MSQRRGYHAGTKEKGVSVKPECKNRETQTLVQQLNGQVVQVGRENYNVDIILDKEFLALATQGGDVKLETEGKRILTLSWTGVKEAVDAVKTSVTLNFRQLLTEVFEEFVWILSNINMLGPLKTLVASIKDKYHARLDHIASGSLVFVFTHQDKESATVMVADKEGVEDVFRTFVSCLQTQGEFSIEVSLDPQEEGGTALTYPGNSDDNEVDPPKGKRDSKETKEKEDSSIKVESMLANLMQKMTSISSDVHVLTNQVKASMYGMAALGAEVALVAKRTGDEGDPEGRRRESRHSRRRRSPPRMHENKHSDGYGQQPLHDQAEKPFHGAPRIDNEKGPSDARVSTHEAESRGSFEEDPTQSRRFDDAEDLLRSINVPSENIGSVLKTCVAEALIEEETPSPRSESMDTLLCIDVSGSIGEHGLGEVKEIASNIVDGIQQIAEDHSLEENIGIIAMGNSVWIVQHPTNDYSQVIEAIDGLECGGRSPIYTALCVCVAAIDGRSSAMSQVHRIPPRVIFITDGHATNEAIDTGPDSTTADKDAKTNIVSLVTKFGESELVPSPIVWIPVGRPDMGFLKALARLTKGEVVDRMDIASLYSYYRKQESIGRIYFCVKNADRRGQDVAEVIQDVTTAFIGDMTEGDQKVVVDAVREKLERKEVVDPDKSPGDYNHIHTIPHSKLPPIGTRVVRGPDWRYSDQDSGGPGTIINHAKDKHHVWVHWDFNSVFCRYRFGNDGKYDLQLTDQSRELLKDELIEIGVRVKRGADWSSGNSDGGEGNCGVVIRKRYDGMVKVRWPNGEITPCRYGSDGKFELEICTNEKSVIQSSTTETLPPKVPSSVSIEQVEEIEQPSPETPHVFWRWKDDLGQWRLYSREATSKLEEEYVKRCRSCVVKKGRDTFRVTFQKPFHERRLQDGATKDVERTLVDDKTKDDLISFEIAIDEQSSWNF